MFERYAVFYCPTGHLADFGAAWLGWDSATGQTATPPEIAGLDVSALTKKPRKYGFHGTLKAPFHLAKGYDLADLKELASSFACENSAATIGSLELRHQNGFIGLRPTSAQQGDLQDLASAVVRAFDPLRAPLTDADIARRRTARLTPTQDAQMLEWGYPFIFDDFHFHLTMTGRVKPPIAEQVIAAVTPHIAPLLPNPFVVDAITLVGETSDGTFHQIKRYNLAR